MLRIELTTQLLRARTLIALAGLAAVPVIAGLATASRAGHRDGNQGGLFGAATYSALNHTMASLDFIAPLLLPLAVAMLASAVGSADRAWGTLRYLYVQPVNRSRPLPRHGPAAATASSAMRGPPEGRLSAASHPALNPASTSSSTASVAMDDPFSSLYEFVR
jgi:ABC-2 type transport system permease protein